MLNLMNTPNGFAINTTALSHGNTFPKVVQNTSQYQPRWYQQDAEYSIFEYFQSGKKGNPVVAMPTGTGKSIVIASFITNVLNSWPNQRVMMLTHVKELIEQNAEKLKSIWPLAPMGVYSAGLNSRERHLAILFGGVQSVAPALKRGQSFGRQDLLIVDECHLMSDKDSSQYQYIIAELKKQNPFLKVIGFTATPYRMKMGLITDNGIFTDICYDITGMESFNRLIAEGFLAPLVAKRTQTEIDTSKIGIVGGEFNSKQLEAEVDKDETVCAAVSEMMELGHARKSWMVFASGIDNTEHIASVIQSYGLDVLPVHSKLPSKVNTERLNAFKAGELRGLVSGQKLTTGFDHPAIDFIADLNPTLSPGKHVQKLGRGTRPAPGKLNCLYADFGGNVKRLGPINDPVTPNKARKLGGEAPVKVCELCGVYNHASARLCVSCGAEFTFETKIFDKAGTMEPMRHNVPIVEYFDVNKVLYNLHEKRDKSGTLTKPPMIRVSYFCGVQRFTEYVTLEHPGIAGKRAQEWWKIRVDNNEIPVTTAEALKRVSSLRMPARIKVWTNKQYPEILAVEW